MAYETDPDVAAFLGGPKKTASADVANKKSSMSGVRPDLQPDSETDYTTDPDVNAFLTAPKQKIEKAQSLTTQALQKAMELKKQFTGAVAEPLATLATGGQAAVVGPLTGLVANIRSGKFGTQEGVNIGRQQAENYAQQTTYQPRTEIGQQVVGKIGQLGQATGPVPELVGFAPAGQLPVRQQMAEGFQRLKSEIPSVRVETVAKPGMQSGGAAAATNQAMLQEAINRATPELANELKTLKPEQVNPKSLENQLIADQLPVPVRLTEGQALQDPNLISFERNERGMKQQLSSHFNEQNRALAENAELIKQRTAEGTYEPDYVANSERAIEAFQQINKDNQAAIKSAYQDLEKLGAGKIEVDSRSFGNGALKALSEGEDTDFLPSIIKTKIDDYANGKAMNFAQYENLRTQIARETRKAQRADDGNAVHALTLVRSELEKLPLLNETAEAKVVADKARSLAAQEFGLLDKRRESYNPVYADIVNGSADTKDFIPKVVLRSKNADFAKAMDMLKDNPDAIKQLRAGALDYMIRESTDASGNFKTGKFTKLINNLDVNKKLTALFGEDAQQIKDLARVGQLIEARPAGAFVNESNTNVAQMASQYAKGALEHGLNVSAKGLPIGTVGRQFLEKRAAAKRVKETLKPGAGVKLSDIGKE